MEATIRYAKSSRKYVLTIPKDELFALGWTDGIKDSDIEILMGFNPTDNSISLKNMKTQPIGNFLYKSRMNRHEYLRKNRKSKKTDYKLKENEHIQTLVKCFKNMLNPNYIKPVNTKREINERQKMLKTRICLLKENSRHGQLLRDSQHRTPEEDRELRRLERILESFKKKSPKPRNLPRFSRNQAKIITDFFNKRAERGKKAYEEDRKNRLSIDKNVKKS